MKKTALYTLLCMATLFAIVSCNEDTTYADQKELERRAVENFVKRDVRIYNPLTGELMCNVGRINAISEVQFQNQGNRTDTARNEYVLFNGTGVYMQIVRKGIGQPLQVDSSAQVVCQFLEYNILGDSIQQTSESHFWGPAPDVMDLKNNSGTLMATFNTTNFDAGCMSTNYGTTVPSGWLVPLRYVGIGRQTTPDEEIAKVRIIVPHTQGHSTAMLGVHPYFYEIKFQKVGNQ